MAKKIIIEKSSIKEFKASLKPVRLIAKDIDTNVNEALKKRSVLLRHQTTQCAVTVILSGYFESFLKEVAEDFINALLKTGLPFQSLPGKIKNAHFLGGGTILSKRYKGKSKGIDSWISASSEDISRRLGSVVGQGPYELVWEAFANTRANPGPDTIREFLDRFGIEKPLEKLGVAAKLSSTAISTRLTSFIAIRNECAHTGRASQVPGPSDIREYCAFLETLAGAILRVLGDELKLLQSAKRR